MIRNVFFILISFIFFFPEIKSQNFLLNESTKVSLLTSSPWDEEVYALFGHSSIRIKDSINHLDLVFNYGLFDFNSKDFIYRFVKGETDYMVGPLDFRDYILEYKLRNVGVTEQVLNLNQEEKQKIFQALVTNSMPQNRVYRYNYFYDNCSTRPRDIIENNIIGNIIYTPTLKNETYRDLVHECVDKQPWVRFGIDLVIGADADKKITDREKDFLPAYLMNAYEHAKIKNSDGSERNLITSESNIVVTASTQKENTILNYPILFGSILFILTLTISIISYKKEYIALSKVLDTILFSVAGILGSVIFFLMFFSVHPCTNPNWNIIWLNPVQLIFCFLFFIKRIAKYVYYYHFINFVALTIFLLAWFLIPQSLEKAFIPFIASIWIRSGFNILQYKRSKV